MSDNCNSCHVTFTDDTAATAVADTPDTDTTVVFAPDRAERNIIIGESCCCGGSQATGLIIFDGTYFFDGTILFDAGIN